MNIDFNPDTEVEAIANGWKTAKEIYTDAGVKKLTWDRFVKTLSDIDDATKDVGNIISDTTKMKKFGKSHQWYCSPEIEKQFQMWLMRNQANQGRSSQLVKETTTTAVGNDIALKEIINSGNVEAMQCLMEHYVNETRAVGEAKRLEQITTQLQLENRQLVEENDYLKKANDFTTAQLGYYRRKYHSYYDDYEIY